MGIDYDEIRITTSREIAICEKKIKMLKDVLANFEKQYGISTATFLEQLKNNALNGTDDFRTWHESHQGLQNWEERLTEYRKFMR